MGTVIRVAVVCLTALLCEGAIADGVSMFKSQLPAEREATTFSAKEMSQLERARSHFATKSVSVVEIDPAVMSANTVKANLPSGQFTLIRQGGGPAEFPVFQPDGKILYIVHTTSWFGWTADRMGTAAFSTTDQGGSVSGSISYMGTNYELRGLTDRFQMLIDVDRSRFSAHGEAK